MAAPLELGGEPLPAPAAVPRAVDEDEPGHAREYLRLRWADARRSPHRDRDAVRRGGRDRLRRLPARSAATSSTTARTGSSSPGRPVRARRSTTASGSTSLRAAIEAVGDRATIVADTGTDSTAHSVELTEAGARGRRRRVPRRHAVLQQAAAARNRRALRGDRRVHRPAGRRLQHPEPRRRQHRARDDLAARRDPERARRQAGARRPRPGAAHRRRSASTSTPATMRSSCRSSSSAASAESACTPTSSARRSPSRCGPPVRATSSAPARSTSS